LAAAITAPGIASMMTSSSFDQWIVS